MKATMKHYRQPARFALSSVLMLVVLTSLVTFGTAAEVKTKPPNYNCSIKRAMASRGRWKHRLRHIILVVQRHPGWPG